MPSAHEPRPQRLYEATCPVDTACHPVVHRIVTSAPRSRPDLRWCWQSLRSARWLPGSRSGERSIAIDDYTRLVANSANFRDIDLGVTQYRGHVREYVFSNDEAIAATAVKDGQALRQLIASGVAKVTNPERHRLLEEMRQAGRHLRGQLRAHSRDESRAG